MSHGLRIAVTAVISRVTILSAQRAGDAVDAITPTAPSTVSRGEHANDCAFGAAG